jgi:hypothetical protein
MSIISLKTISLALLFSANTAFAIYKPYSNLKFKLQQIDSPKDSMQKFKYDIHIDFQLFDSTFFYNNIENFASNLENILPKKSSLIYKKDLVDAYQSKKRYYLLARGISHNQYLKIKELKIFALKKNRVALIVEQKKA